MQRIVLDSGAVLLARVTGRLDCFAGRVLAEHLKKITTTSAVYVARSAL